VPALVRQGLSPPEVPMEYTELDALTNESVHSEDGQPIGSIAAFHMDQQTDQPLFVEVTTHWHDQNLIIPITDAAVHENTLVVPYEADDITQGPLIEQGEAMSVGEVNFVLRYYNAGSVEFEGRSITERPSIPEEPERPATTRHKKKPLPPIVYQTETGEGDVP
jgi:hypothetical protein